MAFMRTIGDGHRLPVHACVRANDGEYLVELEVADFYESELSVESLGRRVTVRANHTENGADGWEPFRLRERLEESFLLPDDAVVDEAKAVLKRGTLEIHAPRARLAPRRLPIEHPTYRVNPDAEPC